MNRVQLAARNNAHLYEAVCLAHDCRTETSDSLLLCLDRPPRFYSQAVTLREGATAEVRTCVTGGFKDSFHDVDPYLARYQLLFSAEWIWMDPCEPGRRTVVWTRAETDEQLIAWEQGWSASDPEAANFPRQFPASLLGRTDQAFYSAWQKGECVAGALFNLSPPVVGVSNVFSAGLTEAELWLEIKSLASLEFPAHPVTGYERGSALAAADAAGFEAIGPLRVWIRTT